jgi:hypothetical protein
MSVVNCNAICQEIEEAELGEKLSAVSMKHLGICGRCQTFYEERLKLRQLVASLETVAAPADFDLRVRARLANQRVNAWAGLWSGFFRLRFASFALACLVLVAGGFFIFRAWTTAPDVITKVREEAPESTRASSHSTQPPSRMDLNRQQSASLDRNNNEARPARQLKRKRSFKGSVASMNKAERLTTREFSSTGAPVIKKEEAVASLEPLIFPIETSSQPLRLSLDYSGGVSRTISVPALSFGSEGMPIGGTGSIVKTSAKGAW